MAESWQKLVDVLLQKNIVKKKTLNEALARHRSTGDTVEKVLVKAELVTVGQLLEAKKEAYGVEPFFIDTGAVDVGVGQLVPQSMCDRYGVICLERNDNTLTLVSSEPLDAISMDYIRMRLGYEMRFRIAYAADFEEARRLIYSGGTAVPAQPPPPPKAVPENVANLPALRIRGVTAPSTRLEPAIKDKAVNEVAQREAGRKTVRLSETEVEDSAELPEAVPVVTVKKGIPLGTAGAATSRFIPLSARPSCALCESTQFLARHLDTRRQLDRILQTLVEALDCEASSLLVLEADGRSLFFKHSVGIGAEDIINMVVPLNEASVAGWVLGHRKPLTVNNTEADPLHNKETDKILQFETYRIAAAPVTFGDQLLGVVEAVNKRLTNFTEHDLETLRIAAAQIALALNNETTASQLNGLLMETVNVLAELLALQGKVSRSHLLDVAQLATAMGREAGLDEAQMEVLSHAAILHDIGALSGDDDDDAREHPRRGAELLARVPMLANLVPHVRMHHERWDGGGPLRLRDVQIPLPARILAIAEAWYERPQNDMLAFMERFGKEFDPALDEVFMRAYDTVQMVRAEAHEASMA